MAAKDTGSSTENLIKETAMRVFFKEGRFTATTQEIADAAGVNRTLLHYYFRSRDILIEKVLLEGQAAFRQKMSEQLDPKLSFRNRMSQLIDIWLDHVNEYPYLDAYLVSQTHNESFWESMKKMDKATVKRLEEFFQEAAEEMKAGRLVKMEPHQFLLNLISLVNYPVIMRPLLEVAVLPGKKAYNHAMAERKEAIMAALFR